LCRIPSAPHRTTGPAEYNNRLRLECRAVSLRFILRLRTRFIRECGLPGSGRVGTAFR
jgi:hypothetical protein